MDIKKLYFYWFYKYYSFFEKYEQTRWLSQTKAMIIMSVLEVWFVVSLYSYSKILIFRYSGKSELNLLYIIIPSFIIVVLKWLAFNNDDWKQYIKEFDRWDNRKNNIGTWIVIFLTIGIFLNLLCSVILLRRMYGWEV